MRPRSLRVVRGTIPEMPRARAVRSVPRAFEGQVTNNPEHPFTSCGGRWVSSTRTTGDGVGTLIQFVPTTRARVEIQSNLSAGPLGRHIAAYSETWEELNRCANFTPTLNDAQRHSMYVQMACHARWAVAPIPLFGGNTWDLEGWRRDVSWSDGTATASRCGRNYGDVSETEAGGWLADDLVQAFADGLTGPRKSWLVEMDGGSPVRRHVATGRAYECLVVAGHRSARWFPAQFLTLIPERGERTEANSCPGQPAPAPVPQTGGALAPTPVPAQPQAAARTWPEQQGSLGANTFTNPYNASGMGQKIQPYQWVEVACKVHAPQIRSANPDGYWYRIASPPWSGSCYAVANTFWNGDVPGQKPYTHNTDFAVPDC